MRRGDRLGVFSERRRSPVAYVFDDRNPRTLAHEFRNHTHPLDLGETVTFDPLVFPYAFSASAFYYVVGKSTDKPNTSLEIDIHTYWCPFKRSYLTSTA